MRLNKILAATALAALIAVGAVNQFLVTSAFAQNPNYTFGNAPRTFGRGPTLADTDLTLLKRVVLHEEHAIEFRAEVFNALNHANLANPGTSFGATTFGKITALSTGSTASREFQLAAHYTF